MNTTKWRQQETGSVPYSGGSDLGKGRDGASLGLEDIDGNSRGGMRLFLKAGNLTLVPDSASVRINKSKNHKPKRHSKVQKGSEDGADLKNSRKERRMNSEEGKK